MEEREGTRRGKAGNAFPAFLIAQKEVLYRKALMWVTQCFKVIQQSQSNQLNLYFSFYICTRVMCDANIHLGIETVFKYKVKIIIKHCVTI